MKPKLDFILICRLPPRMRWSPVTNPIWTSPHAEYFAIQTLIANRFVSYVEYELAGVSYRVITRLDLAKYVNV